MPRLIHRCETCGRTEVLDSDEAFRLGWDYPPRMGVYGVVGPRTCPVHGIVGTVWWQLAVEHARLKDLSPEQQETLRRILNEPASITPTEGYAQ